MLQKPWKCPSACAFAIPGSLPSHILSGNQMRPLRALSNMHMAAPRKPTKQEGMSPSPGIPSQVSRPTMISATGAQPVATTGRSRAWLLGHWLLPRLPTAMSGSAWRPHQNQGCSRGSVFWVPLSPWPAARGQLPGPLEQASLFLPDMVVGKQALLVRGMVSLLLCVTHLHLTGKGETGRGRGYLDNFKVKQERLRKHKS